MCRLFAVTSSEPLVPSTALKALDVMREGHDGSGVGLFLTDLGGRWEDYKNLPTLSGIFSDDGLRELDELMISKGFRCEDEVLIRPTFEPPVGTPKRDNYLIRAYNIPTEWEDLSQKNIGFRLLETRMKLRQQGLANEAMTVFSFWYDVMMLKETGDPLAINDYLSLDSQGISSRIIMAQGRQNTNYAINLYACHPFFIQGFSTMTNGENTAFVPIREYLMSRNFLGYTGYQSDSEVFTHILHYAQNQLCLGLPFYKHIITPLMDNELESHPNREILKLIKHSCRPLVIDGPNCIIGCLPDKTMFMVQDSKKLRPGVVGGRVGKFVFSSEECGLDVVVPERNKHLDFQPMKYDTVCVSAQREKVEKWSQWEALTLQN
ncbi:MAG: glutamate synthase [Deltaproteobacteria bacterium]|nr:glutamate synthase [Deltaproteobacteria bacterium]